MFEDSLGVTSADVFRKIHWRVMPVLCLVAGLCYIDRTNLAFASISLTRDLNFTPEVYGLGSGLFFLGYSIFMIPSNLLMLKFGAPKWLGILITVWGTVAASFCMLRTAQQFYFLRFILGVAEAGAFPAMWYYMYLFYPADQLTVPMSILEAAVATANVFSAPLAAGLMLLGNSSSMKGWQWLFALEGAATMSLGMLTSTLLPRNLQQAEFLNSSEKRWLVSKLEQAGKQADLEAFSNAQLFWDAVSNGRVWYLSCMSFLKNVASHGMLFWCPIIVGAYLEKVHLDVGNLSWPAEGRQHHEQPPSFTLPSSSSATQAVLLSGIPFLCAAVFTVWLGHRSQRKNERAMHLAVPYLIAALLFSSFPRIVSLSNAAGFVSMTAVITAVTGSSSILNSYVPTVASGPGVSVSLALYNSVGNLGGVVGPWLIGKVVLQTGTYDVAFRILGVVMGIASVMAWRTRKWVKYAAAKDDDQDAITKMLEDSPEY